MKKGNIVLAGILAAVGTSMATVVYEEDFESYSDNDAAAAFGWTDAGNAGFWIGQVGEQGNPSTEDMTTAPEGFDSLFLTTARQSVGVDAQDVTDQLVKTVDLSAYATEIDLGDKTLDFSFDWGSNDSRDTGDFTVELFSSVDGSGDSVSVFTVALDDGDGYTTVWASEAMGGAVAAGVRSMTMTVDTTRTGGSESNIWIDNISAQVVPEPATLGLIGLAGALLVAGRRRFKA